jgi:NADPH-dependent glutamate synthase beta subunit-like oxidoreductase
MKSFKHISCDSLGEAVEILRRNPKARPIAGGTDLIGALKDDIHPVYPELLVNLKTISELAYIRMEGEASNTLIREHYTALAEAAYSVATPQIRRMATLGGNLCQETRCWYYRHPDNHFHCLRKGGEICGALVGENRYHSIMGAMRMAGTPCSAHCPAGTPIPDYLESIRTGELSKAAEILLKTNPFPSVTGRVCPHFCQEGCNRVDFDQPVSIREVERYLGDYILEHIERFFPPPKEDSGKHVAIIGSGPGGLAVAYFLRHAGHRVMVYERLEKPGGMLSYSIPAYRLPPDVVEKTIAGFECMGIIIRCGIEIGKDITFQELREDCDAVFLATGAWQRPSIGIDGEELTIYGLDFLKNISQGEREAPGKNVVVIGGGNVAVDVAISAKRLGADQVTMICLESRAEMPALEAELSQVLEEGIQIMNRWGPQRVVAREGAVYGLELKRCLSVFDDHGKFVPQYDPDETLYVETDAILLAVGQRASTEHLPGEMVDHGWIKVDPQTGKTSMENVYAGGDAVQPANVIDAIAASKKAAANIHSTLMGELLEEEMDNRFLTFDPQSLKLIEGVSVSLKPIEVRWIDREDTDSLPQALFESEARRCLNCGCVAVTPSDTGTALIALAAVIVTTQREILAEDFFTCQEHNSTVLEQGDLVVEIRIPIVGPGARSSYRKFRLRESIDFPLVSAAVRLDVSEGEVKDACVVLGAAAPIPLRARAAEVYLTGSTVEEALKSSKDELKLPCGHAAELALEDAVSLQENEYKIQITRAYVRRAIQACLNNHQSVV